MTAPGRLVAGRYRLLAQIGGGGMGTVWTARDELLGRQVAVKQVLPPPGADAHEAEKQRQRALREGRIAARLSNPHTISVYDVVVEDDQPWLVMEHLPSRSLAAVLAEDGPLRVEQVAQIGAQVADALAATHAAGIVHRDVKPANILIGEGPRIQGMVKITDFGISHASGDVTLTQTGQITGTPAFLAPEVAQGEEPTPAGDVFSLGATLYTCLEGQPPFGMSDNSLQQLHRVAQGRINPPSHCGALTRPLLAMLDADPTRRPTMAEVRDQLASLVAEDGDTTTVLMGRPDLRPPAPGRARTSTLPAPATAGTAAAAGAGRGTGMTPTPQAGTGPPQERRRRSSWVWVAIAALIVAALVFGGLLLASSRAGSNGVSPAGGGVPSSSGSSSGSSSTLAPSSTAGPTTSPTPTTSTPTSSAPVQGKDVRDFLREYHQLVIADPEAAWALTGPILRASVREQDYVSFWSQFLDVKVSDVQAEDGSLTATGQLEFRYRDGHRTTEQHRFTLAVGADGQLLMDRDVAV